MAIGIRIIDLQNNPAKYYGLVKKEGKWVPITHPVAGILIMAGIFTLLLSLFLVNQELKKLPTYVYSDRVRRINDVAFWLLVLAYTLNFVSLVIPNQSPLLIETFSLASRALILSSLSLYFVELLQNPIFITSVGSNGQCLVKDGIVGWGLVTFGKMGPQFSHISRRWQEKLQLNQRIIVMNASALLIAAGLGDNFREYEYIIPFQGINSKIVSVCYSFRHYDPNCDDARFENKIPVVFSLFIPLHLMRMVSHILRVEKVISKYRRQYVTLEALSRDLVLEKMAIDILNAIL